MAAVGEADRVSYRDRHQVLDPKVIRAATRKKKKGADFGGLEPSPQEERAASVAAEGT